MEEYKKMFKKVLQFLDDNHYSRAVINGTTSCFNTFEAHLLLTQKAYTPKVLFY